MKEYLVASTIAIFAVFVSDRLLCTRVYCTKAFWKIQIIAAILLTFVDHFSASAPIVIYNPDIILGFRIREIPIENYLFGFAMIWLNLVLFEYSNKSKK